MKSIRIPIKMLEDARAKCAELHIDLPELMRRSMIWFAAKSDRDFSAITAEYTKGKTEAVKLPESAFGHCVDKEAVRILALCLLNNRPNKPALKIDPKDAKTKVVVKKTE